MHWSWDLEQIGYFYRLYDQLMQHWRKVLPIPMYEVDYESLTQNPEAETRKLIDFCGLSWDDRCLAFYENQTAVRTASRIQVREPIYQSSLVAGNIMRRNLHPENSDRLALEIIPSLDDLDGHP